MTDLPSDLDRLRAVAVLHRIGVPLQRKTAARTGAVPGVVGFCLSRARGRTGVVDRRRRTDLRSLHYWTLAVAVVDAWRITAGTTDVSRHDSTASHLRTVCGCRNQLTDAVRGLYPSESSGAFYLLPSQCHRCSIAATNSGHQIRWRIQKLKRTGPAFSASRPSERTYIKRLIGLPGEEVVIQDGIKVNGQPVDVPGETPHHGKSSKPTGRIATGRIRRWK